MKKMHWFSLLLVFGLIMFDQNKNQAQTPPSEPNLQMSRPSWKTWLEEHGIKEVPEGYHDDVRHSAIMMTVDPTTVRMSQRIATGHFSINGINLAPAWKTINLANELIEYQADVTIAAINKVIK